MADGDLPVEIRRSCSVEDKTDKRSKRGGRVQSEITQLEHQRAGTEACRGGGDGRDAERRGGERCGDGRGCAETVET